MGREYFDDDRVGKAYDVRLIGRFLRHLRPYAGWVAVTFLLIVAAAGLQASIPILLKAGVDGPIAAKDREGILNAGLVLLGVVVLAGLVDVLRISLTHRTGQNVLRDLRSRLFRHLLRLPVPYFDRNPTGRLLVRVTNDIENLSELFTSGLVNFFVDLVMLAGMIGVMLHLSPTLTGIVLLALPVILTILLIFRREARRNHREIRRKIARVNSHLAECVQGMRVIRIFDRGGYCRDRFAGLTEDLCRETVRNVRLHSIFMPAMELVVSVIQAGIIWYAGVRIFAGDLTFGTFLAFWYTVMRVMAPLRDLSEKYTILQSAMASSERVFKILDTAPEPARGATVLRRGPAAVEFREVSFTYDGETRVLDRVSFRVEPGERVALVGPTGAGKTTIVNLLLGFYPIQEGDVLVDGRDVREVDPRALRSRFALVTQEVFLFSGSIEQNIRLGDGTVPVERLGELIRRIGLEPVLERFPGGLGTDVRERGLVLSAGQRQLIALARAFCIDPGMVLLDEATSYVDMETEHRVQQATRHLLKGRTALVVAHRLATVRTMDRILVLHRGRIVEEGSHRELVRGNGLYEKLCRLQFRLPARGAPRPSAGA